MFGWKKIFLMSSKGLTKTRLESSIVEPKKTESVHKALAKKSIESMVYHAAVNPKKKEKVLAYWMDDRVRLVVSTIAFGLGM